MTRVFLYCLDHGRLAQPHAHSDLPHHADHHAHRHVNTNPGITFEVGPLVSLGAPAKHGERRDVPLLGGSVSGPGAERQRADGVTDISAHDVIRTDDGALIEVQSHGVRHGPPEVMARLARGEVVAADAYCFRTVMRLTSGHPNWRPLNKLLALAYGQREASRVLLDVWRVA